jgi:DNA repair photolyase
MGLKISRGNMYDWVTHMHTHLGGECPHKCKYCYVQRNRFGVSPRYQGEPRFISYELKTNYGKDKTIFIEHMNDMFAEGIKDEWTKDILSHCCQYPKNDYVFQTKNPKRASTLKKHFPPEFIIGTTIESNRVYENMSTAPEPEKRYEGLMEFEGCEGFITVEPILDFDVDILLGWIVDVNPSFVNIGADSKGCGLPEPPIYKINKLVEGLRKNDITIKKKVNLKRLIK